MPSPTQTAFPSRTSTVVGELSRTVTSTLSGGQVLGASSTKTATAVALSPATVGLSVTATLQADCGKTFNWVILWILIGVVSCLIITLLAFIFLRRSRDRGDDDELTSTDEEFLDRSAPSHALAQPLSTATVVSGKRHTSFPKESTFDLPDLEPHPAPPHRKPSPPSPARSPQRAADHTPLPSPVRSSLRSPRPSLTYTPDSSASFIFLSADPAYVALSKPSLPARRFKSDVEGIWSRSVAQNNCDEHTALMVHLAELLSEASGLPPEAARQSVQAILSEEANDEVAMIIRVLGPSRAVLASEVRRRVESGKGGMRFSGVVAFHPPQGLLPGNALRLLSSPSPDTLSALRSLQQGHVVWFPTPALLTTTAPPPDPASVVMSLFDVPMCLHGTLALLPALAPLQVDSISHTGGLVIHLSPYHPPVPASSSFHPLSSPPSMIPPSAIPPSYPAHSPHLSSPSVLSPPMSFRSAPRSSPRYEAPLVAPPSLHPSPFAPISQAMEKLSSDLISDFRRDAWDTTLRTRPAPPPHSVPDDGFYPTLSSSARRKKKKRK